MKIKLIALDLDGTLLDRDHAAIPPKNLEALRRAAASGVEIAVASGRSWSLIREIAQTLGMVRYALTANGACVLDTVTGQILLQDSMSQTQCAGVIALLRRYQLPYELYLGTENYVQRSDLPGVAHYALSPAFHALFQRCVTLTDDMLEAAAQGVPEKFDVFYVPEAVRPQLTAELAPLGLTGGAGGVATNLEITAPGVNKGRALAALCGRLGLSAGEVMAFGDADNDLEMLSWAGWSFAMENGTPLAKQAAKYQAPPNDQAGVGQMIAQYLLHP